MKKLVAVLFVNILTTVRIVGVFLLLPIYINYGGIAAAMLSVGCYFTDFLDGIIARKCHVATFFGSAYDGIADKMFSVANFLLLITITKFAIIPILCEFLIVIIQLVKFQKNVNVQSSKAGKAKTWVVSFTVILLYLVTDINKISFLNSGFVSYITSLDKRYLYGTLFIPLYLFEFITLLSYLKFLKTYNPLEEIKVPKIEVYLKEPKTIKDSFDNICAIWLSPEFYEKYKDAAGLKDILKQIKVHYKK